MKISYRETIENYGSSSGWASPFTLIEGETTEEELINHVKKVIKKVREGETKFIVLYIRDSNSLNQQVEFMIDRDPDEPFIQLDLPTSNEIKKEV